MAEIGVPEEDSGKMTAEEFWNVWVDTCRNLPKPITSTASVSMSRGH